MHTGPNEPSHLVPPRYGGEGGACRKWPPGQGRAGFKSFKKEEKEKMAPFLHVSSANDSQMKQRNLHLIPPNPRNPPPTGPSPTPHRRSATLGMAWDLPRFGEGLREKAPFPDRPIQLITSLSPNTFLKTALYPPANPPEHRSAPG